MNLKSQKAMLKKKLAQVLLIISPAIKRFKTWQLELPGIKPSNRFVPVGPSLTVTDSLRTLAALVHKNRAGLYAASYFMTLCSLLVLHIVELYALQEAVDAFYMRQLLIDQLISSKLLEIKLPETLPPVLEAVAAPSPLPGSTPAPWYEGKILLICIIIIGCLYVFYGGALPFSFGGGGGGNNTPQLQPQPVLAPEVQDPAFEYLAMQAIPEAASVLLAQAGLDLEPIIESCRTLTSSQQIFLAEYLSVSNELREVAADSTVSCLHFMQGAPGSAQHLYEDVNDFGSLLGRHGELALRAPELFSELPAELRPFCNSIKLANEQSNTQMMNNVALLTNFVAAHGMPH